MMCLSQLGTAQGISVSNLIISNMDLSNITDREDWDYYSPYNNIISIIAICKIGYVTLTRNLMEFSIIYIFCCVCVTCDNTSPV